MAHFTRRQFNAAALSTAFLPLISCQKKAGNGNQLNVGVLLPTSGHQSGIGQQCKKGVDVAYEVLKDHLGIDFSIMFADTESNVNTGRTKAEKLIKEGAHILVGAFDSGVSSAIAQVCEQRQVPFVINISAATQLTEQGYQYVFRNFPTGPMLVRSGITLMKDLFKETGVSPKKAAFIHVKDTYGEAMRQGVEKVFPTLDMPFEIVTSIGYDPKTQDLSTEIAKIKESGADFIMPATRLEDAVLLVKEVIKQKLNIMGIVNPGSPGMYEQEFFKQLGEMSNHWISNTAWFNPKSALSNQVLQAMKKNNPNDFLETSSAFTFEAIHIACDAYKRANSTNAKELRDALSSTRIEDHVCLGGPVQFNEKGQSLNLQSASMQNKDGRPHVIFPVEAREAQPVFPIPSYRKA